MLSSSNPVTMAGPPHYGSLPPPPHYVDLHVNPGESVSIQMLDGNETILRGPATITMVSQHTFPPVPMPVQVPEGHLVQQIVDENGTLRHIILSALNGHSSGSTPSPPSAPVTMIQQTPPPHLPAGPTQVTTSSPQSSAPTLSSQAYPFPCCCSCCFCTNAPPAGLTAAGSTLSAQPALLTGFAAPAGLSLMSANNSARRRPSASRTSYSFSKRQNNNLSNLSNLSSGSSSGGVHPSSNNTTCSAGSAFAGPSPFHSNALTSPAKSHKSGSKSAMPTGIHMDAMSKMIIPPPLNGHMTQAVPHGQQQQMLNYQSCDSSARKVQQTGHNTNNSSELNAGTSVASVVSDLLAKAAAGNTAKGSGMGSGLLHHQHAGSGDHRMQSSASSPVSLSSTPLSLNCHSFRPSSGMTSGKLPVTSSCPTYADTRHSCLRNGLMNTSSSSVVSSSSVSPNSLDSNSSCTSDKFSEVSSDRSDFKSDSGNEIMGLVQNGSVFSGCVTSPPPSSSSQDQQSALRVLPRSGGRRTAEVDESDGSTDRDYLPPVQSHSSSTEILSADASETSASSCCESRLRVGREISHSPRHKSGSGSVPIRGAVVSRDDLTRPENGSKESPIRKHSPLLSNTSAISNKTPNRQSTSSSSQTIASTRISPLSSPKSQSSPSSPVIPHHDPTAVRNRATGQTSPAPSPLSSPDHRKSLIRQSPADSVPVTHSRHERQETGSGNANQLPSPPSSESVGMSAAILSHRESPLSFSNENDTESTEGRKAVLPAVSQHSDKLHMRLKAKTADDSSKNGSRPDSETSAPQVIGRDVETDGEENRPQQAAAPNAPLSQQERTEESFQSASSLTPDASPEEQSGLPTIPAIIRLRHSSPAAVNPDHQAQDGDGHDEDGDDEDGDESPDVPVSRKSSPKSSLSLPQLQLLNLTYTALTATSLKLKWNLQSAATEPHPFLLLMQEKTSGNPFTHHFIAEMLMSNSKSVCPAGDSDQGQGGGTGHGHVAGRTVYQGNASTCRVLHLQCAQQYSFRVRTVVDQHSLVSNLLTITTPEQALNSKQKHRAKQQSVSQQQQAAVQQEQHIGGRSEKGHQPAGHHHQVVAESASDSIEKDDQKRAILILLLFTGFALLVAVLIQHLLASS